MCGQKLAWLKM